MNKLEVSFNSPQCGFMSVGFASGGREFTRRPRTRRTKERCPAFCGFLTELLNQSSQKNEYILKWNREPEEFDFRFFRDGEVLILEIYQYPGEKRREFERELVFAHAGKLRDAAEAFNQTFRQLYKDKDTDEFAFNWRKPFPQKEFDEFQKTLESRADAS